MGKSQIRPKFGKILYLTTIDVTVCAFLIPHIKALQQKGYDVEVACHLKGKARYIQENGIMAYNIPFERNCLTFNNLFAFFKLIRLLNNRKYDLVHVHTPVAAFIGRMATRVARGRKTRIIYTAHGFHFYKGGNIAQNMLYIFLEKLASYWTDALIVLNKEDYKSAIKYKYISKEKLFLVRGTGIDTEKFKPNLVDRDVIEDLKSKLNCGSGKIVAMIAEFNPGKRHIDFVEASEKVLCHEREIKIIFCGAGPHLNKIRNHVIVRKNEDKFLFLGHRSDIPLILNLIDILVLPSSREGLPMIIQEAMASGKPVIASDIRGNRDLVIPEKTGLLVPCKNPEALAEAIIRLLHDDMLVSDMGRKAREVAERELDIKKIVDKTSSIQGALLKIACFH